MSSNLSVMVIAVFGATLLGGEARAVLNTQRLAKHAALIAADGSAIEDQEFAGWIKDAVLARDGRRDVRDAVFLFQQSYGGGMLDDLQQMLNDDGITWVGGAASRYDEPAYGQLSTDENNSRPAGRKAAGRWVADPPQDFWTRGLAGPDTRGNLSGELTENQTLLGAIDAAGASDGAIARGRLETPQSGFGGGGDAITLKDPQATSHHAILWAGRASGLRHFDDIDNIRKALISQWGTGANVTITILFGNGRQDSNQQTLPAAWGRRFATSNQKAAANRNAPVLFAVLPATRDNLMNEILRLGADRLDANAQFVFYATGDGSSVTDFPTTNGCVARGNCPTMHKADFFSDTFVLWQGELIGMFGQPDNVPTLSVSYTGSVSDNAVFVTFVGEDVGSLQPAVSSTVFPVAENGLGRERNLIRLRSRNAAPVTIQAMKFSAGAIDTTPLIDCNGNLTSDAEDILFGKAQDRNGDGVPDQCQGPSRGTRAPRHGRVPSHTSRLSPTAAPTPLPTVAPIDSRPPHRAAAPRHPVPSH
jgi:hypothetical protein